MSKLVSNYSSNGSSTTDEYGTFVGFNRFLQGDVIEGFLVVANGTPNMTVLVQPGSGRITTGTYPASYGYLISHDTALPGESVTIATAAASPRIDYVLAYIDKSVAGSTSGGNVNNTNNVLKFASVAGTPSGSPVVPTLSQIQTAIGAANPYIILAQVAVAASVSTITNPNITDLRVFATSRNALALGSSSYVDNGCVWTISSGLVGTMTKGLVYINVNGVMVPVNLAAIASQTFIANRDTYVGVDKTGAVSVANAVTNGSAAPALPANSIWLALVVTGASTISSITMTGLDSNGNALHSTGAVKAQNIDFTSFPKFRAYLNTLQTSVNGAMIKLDTKTYDSHNAFNTSTWKFTAPVAGYYSFSWNIETSTGTQVLSGLTVNGTLVSRGSWVANSGSFVGSSGSDTQYLNVGDYAQLQCVQMAGTANANNGSASTYMSGRLAG